MIIIVRRYRTQLHGIRDENESIQHSTGVVADVEARGPMNGAQKERTIEKLAEIP